MSSNLCRALRFAVAILFGSGPSAIASPKTVTFQNMSGDTISAITIINKQNPDHIVMPTLTNPIATEDVADLSADLVEGTCLYDITYVYGSGKTLLQESVDLCSTDALIVE